MTAKLETRKVKFGHDLREVCLNCGKIMAAHDNGRCLVADDGTGSDGVWFFPYVKPRYRVAGTDEVGV